MPADNPPRFLPYALAASVALAVGAGVLFAVALRIAPAQPEGAALVRVSVGATTCSPMDLTVPAGRTVFEISNASDRPIEWEILDGVMVVEERENILPGLRALLPARLRPGSYQITCGLLTNPRGTLTVTPTAESETARAAPPVTAFIGPLSEYKVQLTGKVSALEAEAEALSAAIDAGDLQAAQAAWLAARLSFKWLQPVTGRFADLENLINPQADYLAGRTEDPAFVGFHRIESGLWQAGTTEGLQGAGHDLVQNIAALSTRLRALRLAPADLADIARRQADRLAEMQIPSGESHWAGSDSAEIAAALAGLMAPVRLLQPLVADAAPAVMAQIDAASDVATAGLDESAGADRAALAARFAALAQAIAAINPAIGLE